MKYFKPFSFLLAALIGQAASAQTTDPFVALTVPSVPVTVTISTSTNQQTPSTYVGYVVTLTNNHATTLNLIQFNASTSVSLGLTPAVIQDTTVNPDPTLIAYCALTASNVSCNFAALPPLSPGASLSFPVIVKVPSYVGAVVSPASISFAYNATFKNGNTNGSNGNSYGSISSTTTTSVGALSTLEVKSLVVKTGGNFFTGSNGQANSSDVFTTSVSVPSISSLYTTAEIVESPSATCSNFKHCYRSDITIPGDFPDPNYLTIVLRQDATNIKPGTKIESVLILYFPDPVGNPTYFIDVGPCASPTTPSNTLGVPCIAKRVYYKNKFVPEWTLDKDGDFEWMILNTKNGGYKID